VPSHREERPEQRRRASKLAGVLAASGQAALLGRLHERVCLETGAARSVLLERDATTGALVCSSAAPANSLADRRAPSRSERRLLDGLFAEQRPRFLDDVRKRLPRLAELLGTSGALLVPSAASGRMHLLVLGFNDPPAASAVQMAGTLSETFALAVEVLRLRGRVDLQQSVRQMVRVFSDGVSSTLDLVAGLEILCRFANQVFDADRTSVWLHERRRQEMVLTASSDPGAPRDVRVPTASLEAPAARGLRQPGAEVQTVSASGKEQALVVVPLKGRRRALGTMVAEGVTPNGHGTASLRVYGEELGLQLSGAVENVQLLHDVIRSRHELENTFNSIDDLVAVCDRRLLLVHVNRAFAHRVGLSPESLLDRPISDFVGPDVVTWMSEMNTAVGSGGAVKPGPRETRDSVLGGTFSVTLTHLVNQSGDPMGLVMVARDITEQARLEAERAALRERLAQSEKLAALGQFVAGIAHELNNPLQGVLGHIELLNRTLELPRDVKRGFRIVSREAARAAKIVRNLLVFAGSGRMARRPLSVNAVVGQALSLRTEACRALGIEVARSYDDAIPRLLGDPLLLQQALINILVNAEHAVAGRPTRRIEVRTRSARDRSVAIVEVHDSGPGIPADVLPRIFEPFFTTKDVGEGTGLGLAITYGIIQEHDGHISARNHRDGGAVFRIELPTGKKLAQRKRNDGKVKGVR
jgi:two-component system NtrC family sensor kinase